MYGRGSKKTYCSKAYVNFKRINTEDPLLYYHLQRDNNEYIIDENKKEQLSGEDILK